MTLSYFKDCYKTYKQGKINYYEAIPKNILIFTIPPMKIPIKDILKDLASFLQSLLMIK